MTERDKSPQGGLQQSQGRHVHVREQLQRARWTAILRTDSYEDALWAGRESLQAGLRSLELTYPTPNLPRLVNELKAEHPQALIGIGTITSRERANEALQTNADFFVSPHFEATIFAQFKDRVYLPGALTPTEIWTAFRAGARWIKIFPVNVYGVSGLKTVLGPLPPMSEVSYLVTGGVSLESARGYLDLGMIAVGAGANVFASATIKNRDATRLRSALQEWKKAVE